MKLKNLKIGPQLYLGLGTILTLVVILGALAWVQTDRLWQTTKDLYNHPLAVSRAIGTLEADIAGMRLEFREALLASAPGARQTAYENSKVYEAEAARQFSILLERYLGPRVDIEAAQQTFLRWAASRESNWALVRAGQTGPANERIENTGDLGSRRAALIEQIKRMDAFARNKADEFFRDATERNDDLNRQLGLVIGVILLLSVGLGFLLLRGITVPLRELIAVTDHYRQGKLEVRSGYESANEFGTLSAAFNLMAGTLEADLHLKQEAGRLAGVMLGEEELGAFCRALLAALLGPTGSQVGAVYLLNDQQTAFELAESIGLGSGRRGAFSATGYEGEFGAALATRQIQRITDIPADSRFTFATVSGEFAPREIITIPILTNEHVAAVVSLASLRSYSAPALQLVHEIWSVLTARLNGVRSFRQLREFSEKLERQNRELETQKRELATQAGELNEQNTELEMQKRQLDEANRLKSAFLSNMSHELRTPLNSVIALSNVLNRRLAGSIPAEEASYLEVIERNGRQLLALINDILDLSRIEAGREDISLTQFPVRVLVDEVVDMLAAEAREKQLSLFSEVGEDLPMVTSDFAKCRHILQNLVGNAVKFTAAGSVRISARRVEEAIYLAVSDTGIGISADQQAHIFDEFRQGDESTSRSYGGTGLGLAIARKYAELLSGSVTVESIPGQGSTFTLRLPLRIDLPPGAVAESHVAATGGAATAKVADGHGQCILLVEDSEPAVVQMTDILTLQGYRVEVARNGQEALEQIGRSLPDAVILDLMMPQVDGFQVLRSIRETEKSAHLPVIILTAKHVTREELGFLKGNHIRQLIQKGDISRAALLEAVAKMVAPRATSALTPPPRAARPPRSGKPVVLVVEDNPDNLQTARALLQDRYTVIEAGDGRAGVEQARRHLPDLILMDISLPVMDGIAALAELRADATLRHIPVVALTASAMKGNREEILAHGFDGYVSKPIDESVLQQTIQEKLHEL